MRQPGNVAGSTIPPHRPDGALPPGIHDADWTDIVQRFGSNAKRARTLAAMRKGIDHLQRAGCLEVCLVGSFITTSEAPDGYDLCWCRHGVNLALVDPVILRVGHGCKAQQSKFGGRFYPSDVAAGARGQGKTVLELFMLGALREPVGVVRLALKTGAAAAYLH